MRRVGRLAIDLLAGALVLSAIAAWTRVPARFFGPGDGRAQAEGQVQQFLSQGGGVQGEAPSCGRSTVIGTVALPSVTARSQPNFRAPGIETLDRTNAEGARQVVDLEGSVRDGDGNVWYRALLPVRPNGTTGYLPAGSLHLSQTSYLLVVDRRRLTLTLWGGCRQLMQFPIGLGKESTPTPNGRYYLIALLRPPIHDSVYGAYAYGLSAFSDALTDWVGGGIIGLHGTNDPSSIGRRESHGCIRMLNADIERLVPLLPLGTPVVIR